MNKISQIRAQLGVTQHALAQALGMSQGNISFYENGQTVPPYVADKLIRYAAQFGISLTYDLIYGVPLADGQHANPPIPPPVSQASAPPE